MVAKTDWERTKAMRMLQYSWMAFIPGSGAWRDVAAVWKGEKPLKALFFHTVKEETTTGKFTGKFNASFGGSFK